LKNEDGAEQELILVKNQETVPSERDSGHHKDAGTVGCDNNASSGSQFQIWSRL